MAAGGINSDHWTPGEREMLTHISKALHGPNIMADYAVLCYARQAWRGSERLERFMAKLAYNMSTRISSDQRPALMICYYKPGDYAIAFLFVLNGEELTA